jgi:hypothetical protein
MVEIGAEVAAAIAAIIAAVCPGGVHIPADYKKERMSAF